MIKEIRSYFKSVIKEVDSDLKDHKEYFTSDNISDTTLEDTYFLKFNGLSSSRDNTTISGEVDVTLEFWKNGFNDVVNRLDTAFENAIEIQAKLMDQKRIDQTEFIKSVNGSSVVPSSSENNDNLGKFTLQFTVRVSYKAY